MDLEKRDQLRRLVLWTAAITAAHLLVGTQSHLVHGGHILLGALYMFPVLKGAVAFGLRGGVLTALAVMALYSVHVLVSWSGRPMANQDQWAMLGAYLFVGVSAGVLVRQADRHRWERDEVIARSARSETIRGLTSLAIALGERDPDSLRHSEHVARVCEALGAEVGLSRHEIDRLRLAGLVHDVGKIGIADDVLFSSGQFDEQQRRAMHEHPLRAAAMVRTIYGGEDIAAIVEAHHEQPDGSGYPKGLRGQEIPFAARLLRVADVFAALSEMRRYKPAMTRESVMETMHAMSGPSIDRECFEALERAVNKGLIQDAPSVASPVVQGTAPHA